MEQRIAALSTAQEAKNPPATDSEVAVEAKSAVDSRPDTSAGKMTKQASETEALEDPE